MTKRRYKVVCSEGCEIEADTTDDGLFSEAQAHRRAGDHEGRFGHSCEVEVAEETPQYQCPICHTTVTGEYEKEQHAAGEPGMSASSMRRV
jgi:hypothetical protein